MANAVSVADIRNEYLNKDSIKKFLKSDENIKSILRGIYEFRQHELFNIFLIKMQDKNAFIVHSEKHWKEENYVIQTNPLPIYMLIPAKNRKIIDGDITIFYELVNYQFYSQSMIKNGADLTKKYEIIDIDDTDVFKTIVNDVLENLNNEVTIDADCIRYFLYYAFGVSTIYEKTLNDLDYEIVIYTIKYLYENYKKLFESVISIFNKKPEISIPEDDMEMIDQFIVEMNETFKKPKRKKKKIDVSTLSKDISIRDKITIAKTRKKSKNEKHKF